MAKAFEDMGVCPELLRVVEEHDWLVPTPVQAEVIPLLLGGGDVLAAAETGSGKTGAFMLPMLQVIQETLLRPEPLDRPATHEENTPKNGPDRPNEQRVAWNRNDMDAPLRVSDHGLSVSGLDAKRWLGARANTGVRSLGKYYFECEITSCGANGIARVGWSTVAANLDLGMDRHGYGYGGTGKKAHAKQFTAYGAPFSQGDVIGCFLDLDTRRVWFSKNGVAFQADGFTLADSSQATAYFPAVCVKDAVVTARFDGFETEGVVSSDKVAFTSASSSKTIVRANESTASPSPQKGAVRPMGIVIEPSRDLARQVFDCAVAFKKYMTTPSVRVTLCVGGGGANSNNKVPASDLVVATPGRLLDLVKHRTLDLSRVQLLVLDEVDQLIATDAVPAIEKIHSLILASQAGVQIGFFSATLHAQGVQELATKLCRRPLVVDLKGKDFIPETVHHVMVSLTAKEMIQRLVQLTDTTAAPPTDSVHTDSVKSLNGKLLDVAKSEAVLKDKEQLSLLTKLVKPMLLVEMLETLAIEQCMVFCRTNLDCDLLEKYLLRVGGGRGFASGKENQFSCCVLAGMRSMASRQQALDAFKLGEIRVLICTDVAARGIDVPQLACVVNMTLPDTEENYIHRVGRVGRNGHLGLAISLVAGLGIQEKVWFHQRNCKKPRGVGCENRKLLDKGGCTIWYDESALKSGVEKRLGETVTTASSVVELKNTIDKRGGMTQYGRERANDDVSATQSARKELVQLAPHVKTLATLEDKVQIAWLELQQQLLAV